MLIPILKDYHQQGYAPPPRYGLLPKFFPNCNMAVRKKVFEDVGLYSEEPIITGEEVDLCLRAYRGGWDLYYQPSARCDHEPRAGVAGVLKQWFRYGYYSAYFFKKHQREKCSLFVSTKFQTRLEDYRRIFARRRFPFRATVFLTLFSLVHLTLLLAALFLVFQAVAPAAALFALSAVPFALALPSFRRTVGLRRIPLYFFMTYLIYFSCVTGSLLGGIKNRMLYFYSGV